MHTETPVNIILITQLYDNFGVGATWDWDQRYAKSPIFSDFEIEKMKSLWRVECEFKKNESCGRKSD